VAPFHAQADRGVRVQTVPGERLVEVAAERGDVIAFSLVRSIDGVRVDAAIVAAARSRGAWTVVDAAQAMCWLDVDYRRFDVTVAPAFKWLCSPRGSAFLLVDPDRLDQLRPGLASWWSSTDPVPFYAESLRLPDTAKRLDTTPVWTAWPGTLAALRALAPIGVSAIGAHVYRLAARLRHGLGLAEADSAIVLLTEAGAAERLASAGITVATTPAGARLSFHLYTTQADIDRVLDVLAG
jgi:selenocysteine lyase/cysteine desulfurase